MNTVKTAISLPKPLFEQAEHLAVKMNVSRSRLIAMALDEFIRRYQNRKLLENINSAYEEMSVPPDASHPHDLSKQHHKNILEGKC
jgi:metal-responsive CopG/Arc/MetJ family transcriptional regulator